MSDKFILRAITAVSILVFVLVLVLNRKLIPVTIPTPSYIYFFPKLNAIINGCCTVLLLLSLYFISRKNVLMHKRINILTFCLSALFLISYVVFHYFAPETKFGDINGDGVVSANEKLLTGNIRYIYYFVLITHIVLAAAVLPLILLSFFRGLKMQVERHKKLVRWSYPVWLYVTTSGVIVYLMISPYYNF